MRPHLRQVEGIVLVRAGLLLAHDLDAECPARKVARLKSLVKVALVAFAIIADDVRGFTVRQIVDTLLTAEMKFYPYTFVCLVDEAECVRAETVHGAIGFGRASITHHDCNLMKRLRQQAPEIPIVIGATHACARVSFDGVIEIRKPQRIAEKEDGRVVADDVPVSLLGVELDREAANVALGVSRTALSGNGGEADEYRGFLADRSE